MLGPIIGPSVGIAIGPVSIGLTFPGNLSRLDNKERSDSILAAKIQSSPETVPAWLCPVQTDRHHRQHCDGRRRCAELLSIEKALAPADDSMELQEIIYTTKEFFHAPKDLI